MNKAVNAAHCGIGIVSDMIKGRGGAGWAASGGGGRGVARGLGSLLSPDAPPLSHPAENQTSGAMAPAPAAVMESERKRQVFPGHQV